MTMTIYQTQKNLHQPIKLNSYYELILTEEKQSVKDYFFKKNSQAVSGGARL